MPVVDLVAFAKSGPASDARGVGHMVAPCFTASQRYSGTEFWLALLFRNVAHFSNVSTDRSRLTDVAVGHKPEAISSVGRIDGTSRDNCRPDGVTDGFQVRMHSVEPMLPNRSRNLLSHDDIGPSGTDECCKGRPEVPFVLLADLLPRDGKGLAGAASGPEFAFVRPSSQSSSEGPSSNACEEMALRVALEVIGTDIHDAPFINIAGRDMAGGNQVAQPLGGVWIKFVVVGAAHAAALPPMSLRACSSSAGVTVVVPLVPK